ncbi:MAG: hypothetical protein K0U38_03660 [Epsilonproteobacteria bacterium]|nr:hypothetical protein [Campylobacterota bacterium]
MIVLDTNILIEILKDNPKTIEKVVSLFEIIEINEAISKQSTTLIKTYAKSHNLDIPDSLIGSTALILESPLFTYNVKDFRFIEGLELL